METETAAQITQPLDMNREIDTLLNAFSVGEEFSIRKAVEVTGMPFHKVKVRLALLRRTLPHCPEGVQITTKRGPFGYHRFDFGECSE